MALWGDPLARQLLKNLVEKNAFISEFQEYGTLRCHHMLKVCTDGEPKLQEPEPPIVALDVLISSQAFR